MFDKAADGSAESALLERVVDVVRALSRHTDRNDLLEQIVDLGTELVPAERASVLLFDAQANELYAEATSAREEIRFSAEVGVAGDTLARRMVVRLDDCSVDPRFNRQIDDQTGFRTRSMISLPLVGIDDEAVGVLQHLSSEPARFDADDEQLAGMLASFAGIAIQRAQAFADRLRNVKFENDLELAGDLQRSLLPEVLPDCPGYELASFFQPAEETGGDIFDIFPRSENDPSLMILLADATGHGISAAVSVTQMRAMLRMACRLEADLDSLSRQLNLQLAADLPPNRFITAFFGVLDHTAHTLRYQSPGQAPLLIYRCGLGRCDWLSASSMPLGLLPDPPLARPEPIRFQPGDVFVLLSDGIYEHANAADEEFGRERVAAIVERNPDASARELVRDLVQQVADFAQQAPQQDDLTALIVKRQR